MVFKVASFLKRKESFGQGFILSTLLNLVSKVFSFFGPILTAFYFGSSNQTDMFFFATGIMALCSGFLINIDSTKIIPEYMRFREFGEEQRANQLLSFIFYLFIVVSTIVAMIVFVFPEHWIRLFSKFNRVTISSNIEIIRWSGLFVVVGTVNSLLIDVLNSYKRFSLTIISGFANSIINIIVIVCLHRNFGVQSVVIGGLVGSIFQGTVLFFSVKRLSGCRFLPVFFPIDKNFIRYILLSQGAYIFSLFGVFFPLYLLSGLSAGTISALGYSQRLVDILAFILVTQFSNVIAIKLNELFIKNQHQTDPGFFVETGKAALFLSIPLIMIVSVLSVECIAVLFKRGQFQQSEVIDAARFARVFVFLLPYFILNTMVARLIMAAQKIDKSFIFQSVMGILGGLLCYIGIHFLGAMGYPVAQIVLYTINLITVKFLLDRWFPWLKGFYGMLLYGVLIAAINAVIIPIDIIVRNLIIEWHPLVIILLVAPIHVMLFGIVAYRFRLYAPVETIFKGKFDSLFARINKCGINEVV